MEVRIKGSPGLLPESHILYVVHFLPVPIMSEQEMKKYLGLHRGPAVHSHWPLSAMVEVGILPLFQALSLSVL